MTVLLLCAAYLATYYTGRLLFGMLIERKVLCAPCITDDCRTAMGPGVKGSSRHVRDGT